MKKILLLLLLVSTSAFAQPHFTTDKVVVIFDEEGSAPLTLNSTSTDCYFTVRLEGGENGRIYNGYQMDIHLPDGMTVMSKDGELEIYRAKSGWTSDGVVIYPYTEKRGEITYKHSVDGNMISANTLRIGCLSQTVDNFTSTSGDLFHVYVQTSAYMKPGDVKITIDNVVLNANEITQGDGIYHAVSYKPSVECGGTITGVSGACSLNLNVSGTNHWSTCILPFATVLPSGVKAYTSSTYDENNIFLTEAESIEAYTPYILYSEGGYSGNVSGTVDPEQYPALGYVAAGNLTGAIVPQTATEGFVLQKHGEVVQFYAIKDGDSFNIPAGKCWMNIPSNNISAFNFVISDDEDAILSVDAKETTDTATYDLTGRRISKIERGGLYIKNGKKFIQTK